MTITSSTAGSASSSSSGPSPTVSRRISSQRRVAGGRLEDRRVLVDELADRLGQRAQRRAAGRRLGAAALDQAPPQLGGELVQVPAADALVHAGAKRQGAYSPRPLSEGSDPRSLAHVAEIEVQQADITELEVDAIANAANTELRHGGGVAGAISRAGGPAVQAESDERAPIGLGEAVETTAGEMPCRWVIHAATMELGGPTSAEIIRSATASTLAKADQLGARSLALVAFGTGVGGFPLERGRADRGGGGPAPPRAGQRARADRLRRARGGRGGGVPRPRLVEATDDVYRGEWLSPRPRAICCAPRTSLTPAIRSRIEVADMAGAAGLSKAHFSREFHRTFGESPHHYLLTRRLERAAALLRMTDWTRRRDLFLRRVAERRLIHHQLQARLRR